MSHKEKAIKDSNWILRYPNGKNSVYKFEIRHFESNFGNNNRYQLLVYKDWGHNFSFVTQIGGTNVEFFEKKVCEDMLDVVIKNYLEQGIKIQPCEI